MKKLKFLFGVHCHQPVGNFEHIFEEAYEKAYLPFINVLANYPRVKFSAHYSGVLFDWFQKNRPEFMELLKKLVKRGQMELLSGGYYEPILALIPDEDKLAQIELANQFIKENFMDAPRGAWLAERVWEPNLPKTFAKAGIEYVLVDDDHFVQAGFSPDYCITEHEGDVVNLFPINRQLREMIPFKPPQEVVDYLKKISNQSKEAMVVFMDDGEKFGLRQGSDPGYLEKLISLFGENSDWLELTTFSNYLEETKPTGRAYLPCSSYNEMNNWAGGHFRNFLTKHPEANNMHKKMLEISRKIRVAASAKGLFGQHEKEKEIALARTHLYKAQCNCAYWHGLFGGIYLKHLREAVYSHLISAEIELEKIRRGNKSFVELTLVDFDRDSHDEVLISNELLNLYFSPQRGGALFELDYKPKQVNLLNVISRQKEDYHTKPDEYDKHQRVSLLDHFISIDNQEEIGDFVNGTYLYMPKRGQGEVGVRLFRDGLVGTTPVKLEKSIHLLAKQSIVTIDYEIINNGESEEDFFFGVEFNLSSIVDELRGFKVLLDTDSSVSLMRFPIETVSRSEVGLDKIDQGICLIPTWKFKLSPGDKKSLRIKLRIEE